MADITFIVTDSSMKHDYLFIGLDNFSEAEIIGNTFYWLTSLFIGGEHVLIKPILQQASRK